MTRREIFELFAARLSPLYGIREARSAAGIVVQHFCGFTRRDLIVEPDAPAVFSGDMELVLRQLLDFRPVQYVVGRADFCGRAFEVGEGVLVPRPETEQLVDWIVKTTGDAACRILDIGTGSGCIAVSLAAQCPRCRVAGMDISEQALRYARRNAHLHGVKVDLAQADILDSTLEAGEFDIIVSNPPYVPASDAASMCRNVLDYEPHEALFVPDDDVLLFYRAAADFALRSLADGGSLFFEVYENAARQTAGMLAEKGFSQVELRSDLNSKPRMIRCRI